MPPVTLAILKDQISDAEHGLKTAVSETDVNRLKSRVGEVIYQLRNAGWMIEQIQRDPENAGFIPRRWRL